jgi:DNA-binding CsgD family transcriptional regulator
VVRARILTPTEQRIALLVASGRTSADVAVELGLSATTVEWHLSRAVRKLGVRSREDLAAVLGDDAGERIGEAVE